MEALQETLARLSFSQSKRQRFYALMRDFVADGMPVFDALKSLHAGCQQLSLFPQEVLSSLMTAMRGAGGSPATLGEALSKWVDPVESALIDAGQRAGRLEAGLSEVHSMMEVKARIRGTIISSMTYPAILLLMLGGFMWMMSSHIIPIMQDILPRARWSFSARVLGGISDNTGLILGSLFGAIALVAFGFAVTATKWVGPVREALDKWVMPWSVYLQIQASMLLISISMMVESGVPVGSAISQLHAIGSSWQREHLERMQSRMRRGRNEAEAIVGLVGDNSMFDKETAWEVRMYGGRTTFATSLKSLAMRGIARLERRLVVQANMIRNILMALVAGLLALTAASFMSITMSLTSRAV
ncbi:MAG: type II secretion system F family protein [Rhodocyclaceae bacterium]|nr:type II secretion system F family protein [Rhodocyclaceae bacterium]